MFDRKVAEFVSLLYAKIDIEFILQFQKKKQAKIRKIIVTFKLLLLPFTFFYQNSYFRHRKFLSVSDAKYRFRIYLAITDKTNKN